MATQASLPSLRWSIKDMCKNTSTRDASRADEEIPKLTGHARRA